MDILNKIVAFKINEVKISQLRNSISSLESSEYFERQCNSYVSEISKKNSSGVIAEFKRKSPSRSDINLNANLDQVTTGYVKGGASAISILTDVQFFGGSNNYLTMTRDRHTEVSLLRKEFIIDEYQVLESKAIGADIILLICEILTPEQIKTFSKLARSLGMEVLLEMHTADQIHKFTENISMVGINNRDLKTFKVDYERSKVLFDQLPSEVPKIAESGLSKTSVCHMLYDHGFRGFLIGEQFMKQENPGDSCREFICDLMSKRGEA